MMGDKIKLGISSCLLGNPVRYNGQHQMDRFLTDQLGQYVEWVPVCPEVECGLPVPRETMRLVGLPESPRLVTTHSGIDHTGRMLTWIDGKLPELEKEELCGFVFKSKSPSSGMQGVKIYTAQGMPSRQGSGLFAGAFMERFPILPVEDEGRLNDAGLRENFIERIFVMHRWKHYMKTDGSPAGLVDFHTRHKLLLMAHSPGDLKPIGNLVAQGRRANRERLQAEYLARLMSALAHKATVRKNTNVLDHIMGYFKKQLTADEKVEMKGLIAAYYAGLVPLIVPIVMLRHYVRKFDEPYLKEQFYLHPHPSELKLRNHA
jgi:uncharacterized protein YbgA (DUF1722 family)/uncharacterized protein YbbK (DUF523 family)